MVIAKVTQVGSPIIRCRSLPVRKINSIATERVVKNLIDSMRKHSLVGMAAPQIGSNLRIFVTEVRDTKYRRGNDLDAVRVFINPTITGYSKSTESSYEGCGSVGNASIFAKVRRARGVSVTAKDRQGKVFKLEATGLLARIIQHEQDHLDGKVFLDRDFEPKSLCSYNEYIAYCDRQLKKSKKLKR